MLISSIKIKVAKGPTVFAGLTCIYMNIRSSVDSSNMSKGAINFVPAKIKGKYGSFTKFIDSIILGITKEEVNVDEKYYDSFFYALSCYIRTSGYKLNHLVLTDADKLKPPESWKILYSLNYKTLMRVQVTIDDMPKLPPKLLTTINISSPKVWVTSRVDLSDLSKLDPKFTTKSDEIIIDIFNEGDCLLADNYLTSQKYISCPVYLNCKSDAAVFKAKKLAAIHNTRYFKDA